MPSPEELRWIKATANELNNLLQIISESGQALDRFLSTDPEADKFSSILRTSTERAKIVVQSIANRADQGPDHGFSAAATRIFPADRMPAIPAVVAGEPEIHNPEGEGELILIVDDEEFITLLAKEVLTEAGYRVVTAKNGFQALDIFRRLKAEIALVILDFVMPVMDGADVFAELIQLNPKVSVVLSSGFAEQDRLRGMLSRGLRGFIPKPYTQQKLLDQVRQTLDAIRKD
jgi:CheY-like chemotaxis protein